MLTTILDKLTALSLNVAVWALVVTMIIAVLNARRTARIEREENYIQLELASNDLFRFEAANAENIEPFLEVHKPDNVPAGRSVIRAFLFQTLNLFEIAVRLRADDRFGKQAFGTWVIWFFDTCDGWFFREEWPELRENYTVEIRQIFDKMVAEYNSLEDPEKRKDKFFTHVASTLNCPIVKSWRDDLNASSDYKKTKKKAIPSTATSVTIKLATADDHSVIAQLISTAIQTQTSYLSHGDYFAGRSADGHEFVPNLVDAIKTELADPDSNINYALAYSNNGDAVGCAAFFFESNDHQKFCVLDDIVVLKEARSTGVGAALYDFVIQQAQQRDAKKILLESGAGNHSAHRYFEGRGFKVMSKSFYKDL